MQSDLISLRVGIGNCVFNHSVTHVVGVDV